MTVVLFDSGPLGLVTHPRSTPEGDDCKAWLKAFLSKDNSVFVPEIIYYEVRRELRRSEMKNGVPSTGLVNLEAFTKKAGLLPITSDAILLATEFWAEARHKHFQGAPDAALDGDMILCAQAHILKIGQVVTGGEELVVIVTRNARHLVHFADARHWRDIPA